MDSFQRRIDRGHSREFDKNEWTKFTENKELILKNYDDKLYFTKQYEQIKTYIKKDSELSNKISDINKFDKLLPIDISNYLTRLKFTFNFSQPLSLSALKSTTGDGLTYMLKVSPSQSTPSL